MQFRRYLVSLASISATAHAVITSPRLRILPLGDSITWGFKSTDGNGYRLSLYESLLAEPALASAGVIFAGTERHGNMTDNWNEGHNGYAISQIQDVAQPALDQLPNVVLLHAGTNDLNANPLNQVFSEAPKRLRSLIDFVFRGSPNTTLFLAQIVQSGDAAVNERVHTFNNMIPEIVQDYNANGHRTVLVNMSVIAPQDLSDGVHPNDAAYVRMGTIWSQAILSNLAEISPPSGPDPDPNRPQRKLGDQLAYPNELSMPDIDWGRLLAGFGATALASRLL